MRQNVLLNELSNNTVVSELNWYMAANTCLICLQALIIAQGGENSGWHTPN